MSELTTIAAPGRTALLCMEMQRGVVGDLADHPAALAVRNAGTVQHIHDLAQAARANGIRVVHCTAAFRPDRAGSFSNMPVITRLLDDNPDHLLVGSPATEVIPELRDDSDLESPRFHGISPFSDTSLDTLLRTLGVHAVVATGVSLNRGIVGMTMEAVNRGYDVVIPTDCVAGYPTAYAEQVLKHTLAAITSITTSADLVAAWSAPAGA